MYYVHFVWRTTYAVLLRCLTSFPSNKPSLHHPSDVVMPSELLPGRWWVPGHCGLLRSDSAFAFCLLEVKFICELSVPARVEGIALSIIWRTSGKADWAATAILGGFLAQLIFKWVWHGVKVWTSVAKLSGRVLILMAILNFPPIIMSNVKVAGHFWNVAITPIAIQ